MSSKFRAVAAVAIVMIFLGFLGVILTDVLRDGAWQYWRILTVVFALLSMGLNEYLRRKGWKAEAFTFWHELAHWLGLILCISVISFLVQIGILSRYLASLQILILLAFSTYLIGVYIEKSFILIGIVLGLFAAVIAFFSQFLYIIIIPLTLIIIGSVLWMLHRSHKKSI